MVVNVEGKGQDVATYSTIYKMALHLFYPKQKLSTLNANNTEATTLFYECLSHRNGKYKGKALALHIVIPFQPLGSPQFYLFWQNY